MTAGPASRSEVFRTAGEEETIGAGAAFAAELAAGDVVACHGNLGAGKTRFVQGICRALGASGPVTSPTFTILNEYRGGRLTVYHFDFYRLTSAAELRQIDFQDYLDRGDGVIVIEWPERIPGALPPERIDVHLAYGEGDNDRIIRIDRPVGAPR